MERRYTELRHTSDGIIEGRAMPYGEVARISPRRRERFEPRSLIPTLDVFLNLMHNREKPIARTGAGLELIHSDAGMDVRIDLPDHPYANEARGLVETGVLSNLSIDFDIIRQRFEGDLRIVEQAVMPSLAIVDRPAYPSARIVRARSAAAPLELRPFGDIAGHIGWDDTGEFELRNAALDQVELVADGQVLASTADNTLEVRDGGAGIDFVIPGEHSTPAVRKLRQRIRAGQTLAVPALAQGQLEARAADGSAIITSALQQLHIVDGQGQPAAGWPGWM